MPKGFGHTTGYARAVDLAIIGLIIAALAWLLLGSEWQSGTRQWQRLRQFFIWRDEGGAAHAGLLLKGLFMTLRVSFWSMLLAAALGLCFGFMRISSSLFLRLVARTYVLTIRNIPPLVLLFVVHFFIGMLLEQYIPWGEIRSALRGLGPAWVLLPLDADLGFFCSAVLTLGLYEGVYVTEIVRAGLESVPRGQWEAARSLGLPRRTMLFAVVLPQAFRLMLPPLVSQAVTLVKDSSIVSAISLAELTYQGRELSNTTFMVFELWAAIALLYLGISLILSGLGHVLERRVKAHI